MHVKLLQEHLAKQVAADRGISLEEATWIVGMSLRAPGIKTTKSDPPKGASERKKKRTKANRATKVPLTAKQKIARRFGPDDGRSRGGNPFIQGGAPGLGKR